MSFDLTTYRPAQQGHLDGFCGLYAVVNFICRHKGIEPYRSDEEVEQAQQIFQQILESLFKRRKVTASRMIDGFKEGHLQKAFNEFCRRQAIDLKAYRIDPWVKKRGYIDIFELMEALEPEEGVVLSVSSGDHWVLAHSGSSSQFWVDDSNNEPRPKRIRRSNISIYDKISLDDGLVIRNA